MEWIKVIGNVRDCLPVDGTTFLALWKGTFCLARFDEEINLFYLQMHPGDRDEDMKVSFAREGKFTHWCRLELPIDY